MSASDERMMESAIAMANEFVSHGTKSHMMDSHTPPTSPTGDRTRSDSESGAESPKLIQKIKNSIKRSPKIERKRTFSEEIQNKVGQDDDVPPEAQEAYNMLVVRGSVKEKASAHEQRYDRSFRDNRGLNDSFNRGFNDSFERESSSPLRQDRQSPFRQDSRGGKRESPRRGVPLANTAEVFLDHEVEDRPTPKPRTEIKRSEIPVPAPKPRPEIIQRVEPVPRPQQPPPSIPSSLDYELKVTLPEEKVNGTHSKNIFRYSAGSDLPSEESSEHNDSKDNIDLHIDLPDSDDVKTDSVASDSPRQSQIDEKPKTEQKRGSFSKTSDLFCEDFSEPSPREIMSKLARESRIRRSLDHQRGGLLDGGDTGPSKNIREPQGIPGKRFSSSNAEEEEEDTNPLRMLRGGAIPIRGGRVGQGTHNNSSSVPKLRVKIPVLHHSMSVDTGVRCVEHGNEALMSGHENGCSNQCNVNDTPPAIPPRSYSMSGETSKNPIPLPPRRPLTRSTTLNATPRGRKYPLLETDVHEGVKRSHSTASSSDVAWQSKHNAFPATHGRESELPRTPSPPPPPIIPRAKSVRCDDKNDVNENIIHSDHSKSEEEDDNVFEPEKSPLILRKNINTLSDSGESSRSIKLDISSANASKSATFPRGKFKIQNVDCNLEQLGFYNGQDPFWDQNFMVAGRNLSRGSSEEVSPLMLANYKTSEAVSYEDLLDFALDRYGSFVCFIPHILAFPHIYSHIPNLSYFHAYSSFAVWIVCGICPVLLWY